MSLGFRGQILVDGLVFEVVEARAVPTADSAADAAQSSGGLVDREPVSAAVDGGDQPCVLAEPGPQ